jgi:hypothetical protein
LYCHEPRRSPPDTGAVARGRLTGAYVMQVRRRAARELIANGQPDSCRDLTCDGEALPTVGLTPSELVVGRLVATGLSNREVAAEIFVSVKAVELHLGHILAASDNAGSLRVLQKAGFHPIGTEVSFAPGRGAEIEETILELP